MAFDPTKPVDGALVSAAELRAQFTGLKALLDAQAPVYGRLAADWTNGTAAPWRAPTTKSLPLFRALLVVNQHGPPAGVRLRVADSHATFAALAPRH